MRDMDLRVLHLKEACSTLQFLFVSETSIDFPWELEYGDAEYLGEVSALSDINYAPKSKCAIENLD